MRPKKCPKYQDNIKQSFQFYYDNVWSTLAYKIQEIYADVLKENLKNKDIGKIAYQGIIPDDENDFCKILWKKEYKWKWVCWVI